MTVQRPRGEHITQRRGNVRRDGATQGRDLEEGGGLERDKADTGSGKTLRCSRGRDPQGRRSGASTRADRGATAPRRIRMEKTSGRMKTRRASASCTTLNRRCRGTDSRREKSPEDGLPGETRGLIHLDTTSGPIDVTASVRRFGSGNVRRARDVSKERPDLREE